MKTAYYLLLLGPLFQVTSFKPQELLCTLCSGRSTEGSWVLLFQAGQFNSSTRLLWPLSCHCGPSVCVYSHHPARAHEDKMDGFCSWVDLGSRHFLCCLCLSLDFSHYLSQPTEVIKNLNSFLERRVLTCKATR